MENEKGADMKNTRDIHGDGHGFVGVSVGRPTLAKRDYRFNYDLDKLPTHDKPFLGLFIVSDESVKPPVVEPRIIKRAKPHRNLRFTSYENHYYMPDPIAWAEIPHYG
jgi:hypothetical protein